MNKKDFKIDCTGDVVVGDIILFTEIVWTGSYRKPVNSGERTIIAKVLKDSYGEMKQQHTFTIEVIKSYGVDPISKNSKIRRKGRNIYRNGTKRLSWECPEARILALNEKHERGDKARGIRQERRVSRRLVF